MNIVSRCALSLCALALAGPAAAQDTAQIEAMEQRIAAQQQQLDEMQRELEALKAAAAQRETQAPTSDAIKEKPLRPMVWRKNENLEVQFSGRVHRMLLNVDDGANTDMFFTDSEQGPTMLRFDVTGKASDTLTIGAALETGIRQNRPFLVSQDNRDTPTSVNMRNAEVFASSTRLGKLSLGRGFASAWLAPEMDLSGTQFANLLPVGMLAPGMKFVNAADNSLSDVQVLTHFVDVERLLLVDRIRYDSPSFGPGLQVSGSLANDDRWDLTLRVKPKTGDRWTVVGGASFQDRPFETIEQRRDAVLSLRHNPSGLNLTVGASREELTVGRDVNTWLVKAGWLADIVSLGKTAFSVDYYENSDLRLAGDAAQSFGLFAVQKWPDYGLDFYLGYRRYDVKRPDVELKELDIAALGVAFSF